jgi:D-serine dehydratase
MSPQLVPRLLKRGCWGISAATLQQAAVILEAGAPHVLLANQIGGREAAKQFSLLQRHFPQSNLYLFVDSTAAVKAFLDWKQESSVADGKLCLLMETGIMDGRAGVRTKEEAVEILDLIASHPDRCRLSGIACYEGAAARNTPEETVQSIDALLDFTLEVFEHALGFRESTKDEFILSAGGSAFFDRVVMKFSSATRHDKNVRVVLRSGAFLFYDHGIYRRLMKEMDARRGFVSADGVVPVVNRFQPALRLWGQVLSRPEANLAIMGMGARDMSSDQDYPIPLGWYRDGVPFEGLSADNNGCRIIKINDQHTFLEVPEGLNLRVGDLVEFGISHPCTCIDKWTVFYGVDDDLNVVRAYKTFF